MPLLLRLAELFQRANLAIGGRQRFAAAFDLGQHRGALFLVLLLVDAQHHLVAMRGHQTIDVHPTRLGRLLTLEVVEFLAQLVETFLNRIGDAECLGQLSAPLVASRLAEPQQRLPVET